jgi:putative ABC transport system ATP-binding protein
VIHQPALLIADEPTGNLDSENGARVLSLLSELNREMDLTILLATHSPETSAAAKRIIHMQDGRMRDSQIESIAEQKPEAAQSAIV